MGRRGDGIEPRGRSIRVAGNSLVQSTKTSSKAEPSEPFIKGR